MHISFVTSKIDKVLDCDDTRDPEGLKKLYYLAKNLRSFVLALISLHFKVCCVSFSCAHSPSFVLCVCSSMVPLECTD